MRAAPVLEMVVRGKWMDFLGEAVSEEQAELFRRHEPTGRPLGGERFVTRLEKLLRRVLHPRKPGRKPKRR